MGSVHGVTRVFEEEGEGEGERGRGKQSIGDREARKIHHFP